MYASLCATLIPFASLKSFCSIWLRAPNFPIIVLQFKQIIPIFQGKVLGAILWQWTNWWRISAHIFAEGFRDKDVCIWGITNTERADFCKSSRLIAHFAQIGSSCFETWNLYSYVVWPLELDYIKRKKIFQKSIMYNRPNTIFSPKIWNSY